MFRFLGEKNGIYTVRMVDGRGNEIVTETCAKPCEYLKLGDGQRVKFNSDSLGGAAMEDALNGQLEIYEKSAKSKS